MQRMLVSLALVLSLSGWVIAPLIGDGAAQAQAASFYGTVYDDRNRNGMLDAGDAGLPGVTVNLFDTVAGVVIASQASAADGSYNFSVEEPFIGFNRAHNYAIYVTASGGVAVPTSPPVTMMLGGPAAVWTATNLAIGGDCCTTSPAPPYNFGFAVSGYGIANPYAAPPSYSSPFAPAQSQTTYTGYQGAPTYQGLPGYVVDPTYQVSPSYTGTTTTNVISEGVVEAGGMLYINLNAGESTSSSSSTAAPTVYQYPYTGVYDQSQVPSPGNTILVIPAPPGNRSPCAGGTNTMPGHYTRC